MSRKNTIAMTVDPLDQRDDSARIGTRTRMADDDVSDTDRSPDGSAGAPECDPTPIVPHTRVPR